MWKDTIQRMVSGLQLYSTFLVYGPLKVLYTSDHIHPIHTTSYADGERCHAGYQPVHQRKLTIHAQMAHIRQDQCGVSILAKDTLICRLEEPGIEPLIFRLVDDLSCKFLDLLYQSCAATMFTHRWKKASMSKTYNTYTS